MNPYVAEGITIAVMGIGFFALWRKLRQSIQKVEDAEVKAAIAHAVVVEIKVLATRTEEQTNSRLTALDAKIAANELKSAEQLREIAELKLALEQSKAKEKT